MFEFDEHYDELEALQAELAMPKDEHHHMLPAWSYVGNDVWKLDFVANSLETSQEWRLQTVDIV